MQADLIYNPRAGQVSARRELGEAVDFLNRSGWQVTVHEANDLLEATRLARHAVEQKMDVVIAAGGDGTVNAVANGLVGTTLSLGVLPMGTTNVWALQMRIPALNPMLPSTGVVKLMAGLEQRVGRRLPASQYRKVLLDAARVLIEGRTVPVDVGEVSGHHFILWAGIGLDAAVARSISQRDKKSLGSWAYVVASLGAFGTCKTARIRLTVDGEVDNVSTPLIIVSNIQLYGAMLPIGARAQVNDGKLDMCVFKGSGFFTFASHALKVVSHRHLHDPNIQYRQCSQIAVESDQPLPVQVDGEPIAQTPVTIRTLPSALRVIVPMNTPAHLFHEG